MRKINFLDNIDAFLQNKKNSEIQMLRFCIFVVVSFVIYSLFWSLADEFYEEIKISNELKTQNLNQILNSNLNNQELTIATLNDQIKNLKKALQEAKDINKYFDERFLNLSNLTKVDKFKADFLDSLSKFAKENDVKILQILNSSQDSKKFELNEILSAIIQCQGNFINTLKFINKIEASILLTDVSQISILPHLNELNSTIKIDVFGVKYQ
ncbi:MAG: hypothetical protein ACTTJC_01520 [Campylobacter sp.]